MAIIRALVDGVGVRATERITDTSREMVLSLLVREGDGCAALHDRMVRNLACERIECDELWGFVQKKQRQITDADAEAYGDQWTWAALDPDGKFVAAYRVGKRDAATCNAFVADLAARLATNQRTGLPTRVQISTDGLGVDVDAIERAFGGVVDCARVVKDYEAEPIGAGRYFPPQVNAVEKTIIAGDPDLDYASTSHVERLNLSIRMENRRHTRLTNAFSNKLRNHESATALFFPHYNFVRSHRSIRMTPAVAANVTEHPWEVEELVDAALAAREAA